MIKDFEILFIVSFLIFFSCQNRKSNNKAEKSSSGIELKSEDSSTKDSGIVISTTTNKDGSSLKCTFNNSLGTCMLELKGEMIELKQERMASGIKYSNEHFVYTNWHGETKLYKDGKLIFSSSK